MAKSIDVRRERFHRETFHMDNAPDELLQRAIDSLNVGIVIVDKTGVIRYLNKPYCDFLEVEQSDAVGKHVTQVIENTRMHEVIKTGRSEIAQLQLIRGNYMIASRIPIFRNGEIVGAVGMVMFRDTDDWKQMNSHIRSLLSELEYYRHELKEKTGVRYSLADLIGESPPMKRLKEQIKRVASSNVTVLIRGESGTGKELVAHSIHQLSERADGPFVKVNCGAIPEHLLESELFGYEEGAFTGARKGGKLGKFQLADGGTIFLDEIGDLPLNMQVKLLRVLQEMEVEPVGSTRPRQVNVRVLAATNRPLEKMVVEGTFREDLFYRINVIQILIPPLRERMEDLGLLARFFLSKIARRTGKRIKEIDEKVFDLFYQHRWPGNIRELENVIEAAIHLANGETITRDDLPDYLRESPKWQIGQKTLKEIVEETERRAIEMALKKYHYDRQLAAKALGISKTSMYDKIKKYGLGTP